MGPKGLPNMTTYCASTEPHNFDSARDAIDAVSAFESQTLSDWEYHIETTGAAWRVKVNCLEGRLSRGYIAIDAEEYADEGADELLRAAADADESRGFDALGEEF